MKGRYVTKQILLACRSRSVGSKKDIHGQLEETMAERRKILTVWERVFLQGQPLSGGKVPAVKKDIHAQLAETIAEYKRIRKQSQQVALSQADCFLMREKSAA